MRPRLLSTVTLGSIASVLCAGACSNSSEVADGSVQVSVSTEGSAPDGDGYLVVINDGEGRTIDGSSELTIRDLTPGSYRVRLDGLAAQCYVVGSNPQSVTVRSGEVAVATFLVACPGSAGVKVNTNSTGAEPDPDGYLVSIGGGSAQRVPANGTRLVSSGSIGSVAVAVEDIATNCVQDAANPTQVGIAEGQSVTILLKFSCPLVSGTIGVTVSVTGQDVQTNGLLLSLDGATQPVTPFVPITLRRIAPGQHSIGLERIAANCTVEGENPRAIGVDTAQTLSVSFALGCREIPRSTVAITTTTTGADPDLDGYQVNLQQFDPNNYYGGSGPSYTLNLPPNGSGSVRLLPGYYSAVISGMAGNCRAVGLPQVIQVGAVDQSLGLLVECEKIRRLAYVSVAGGGDGDIALWATDGREPLTIEVAGADSNPAWSPSGTELVFTAHRDGNAEIYRMTEDGVGSVRLTSHAAADYRPAWSPDGSRIAFVSERDGNAEIYVMGRDGSNLQRLTNTGARDTEPAWSPDGTRIAFVSNRELGMHLLYVMNSDGTGVSRITTTGGDGDRTPVWSPDGSLIAFSRSMTTSAHQLFVVGPGGANPRPLSFYLSLRPVDPDWSRDGQQIIIARQFCDSYYYSYFCNDVLEVIDPVTRDSRMLLGSGGAEPAWRP